MRTVRLGVIAALVLGIFPSPASASLGPTSRPLALSMSLPFDAEALSARSGGASFFGPRFWNWGSAFVALLLAQTARGATFETSSKIVEVAPGVLAKREISEAVLEAGDTLSGIPHLMAAKHLSPDAIPSDWQSLVELTQKFGAPLPSDFRHVQIGQHVVTSVRETILSIAQPVLPAPSVPMSFNPAGLFYHDHIVPLIQFFQSPDTWILLGFLSVLAWVGYRVWRAGNPAYVIARAWRDPRRIARQWSFFQKAIKGTGVFLLALLAVTHPIVLPFAIGALLVWLISRPNPGLVEMQLLDLEARAERGRMARRDIGLAARQILPLGRGYEVRKAWALFRIRAFSAQAARWGSRQMTESRKAMTTGGRSIAEDLRVFARAQLARQRRAVNFVILLWKALPGHSTPLVLIPAGLAVVMMFGSTLGSLGVTVSPSQSQFLKWMGPVFLIAFLAGGHWMIQNMPRWNAQADRDRYSPELRRVEDYLDHAGYRMRYLLATSILRAIRSIPWILGLPERTDVWVRQKVNDSLQWGNWIFAEMHRRVDEHDSLAFMGRLAAGSGILWAVLSSHPSASQISAVSMAGLPLSFSALVVALALFLLGQAADQLLRLERSQKESFKLQETLISQAHDLLATFDIYGRTYSSLDDARSDLGGLIRSFNALRRDSPDPFDDRWHAMTQELVRALGNIYPSKNREKWIIINLFNVIPVPSAYSAGDYRRRQILRRIAYALLRALKPFLLLVSALGSLSSMPYRAWVAVKEDRLSRPAASLVQVIFALMATFMTTAVTLLGAVFAILQVGEPALPMATHIQHQHPPLILILAGLGLFKIGHQRLLPLSLGSLSSAFRRSS